MSKIRLVKQATAPGTPGTNEVLVYADSSSRLATKNDAGTVRTTPDLSTNNSWPTVQTINGVAIGGTAAPGLSILVPGVLNLKSSTVLAINAGATATLTGFSWGLLVALVEIPGTALEVFVGTFNAVAGVLLAGGTYCSITSGTASKVNFYISGGAVTVQNNRAVAINCYIHALGT
jgi:hypothetical protein